MKAMYKDGQFKAVHNYKVDEMRADGWSFNKGDFSKKKVDSSDKKEKNLDVSELSDTHKQAIDMGIEIYKDGKLIHHRAIAAKIREAKENADKDQG